MTEVIERELTQQYEKYYRFAFSVVRNREDRTILVLKYFEDRKVVSK